MNRSFVTILTSVVVASCLASTSATAGIHIQISPPAAFIATTSPVYYEGHAAYWYGGSWQYRDGGRWQRYQTEPRSLHERRTRQEPQRHFYGRERR